jgi:hypothetical protein
MAANPNVKLPIPELAVITATPDTLYRSLILLFQGKHIYINLSVCEEGLGVSTDGCPPIQIPSPQFAAYIFRSPYDVTEIPYKPVKNFLELAKATQTSRVKITAHGSQIEFHALALNDALVTSLVLGCNVTLCNPTRSSVRTLRAAKAAVRQPI